MTPVNGNTFFEVLEQFCAEFGIASENVGDHVYLQNVKISQPENSERSAV